MPGAFSRSGSAALRTPRALPILLQRAAETALEDLPDHGEVVARPRSGRTIILDRAADGEFAVGLLQKAGGARRHHDAIGIGALDMAVVVDLDPLGRGGQV